MPIPKPHEKEKKEDFISRCMSDSAMISEYADIRQRAAICYNQWNLRKKFDDAVSKFLTLFRKNKHD